MDSTQTERHSRWTWSKPASGHSQWHAVMRSFRLSQHFPHKFPACHWLLPLGGKKTKTTHVIRVITRRRYQIYDVERKHTEVLLECSSSLSQNAFKILWKRPRAQFNFGVAPRSFVPAVLSRPIRAPFYWTLWTLMSVVMSPLDWGKWKKKVFKKKKKKKKKRTWLVRHTKCFSLRGRETCLDSHVWRRS